MLTKDGKACIRSSRQPCAEAQHQLDPATVGETLSADQRASEAQMAEALAATEICHLADAQMSNLSGGEFQRVLITRASSRTEFHGSRRAAQGVDFNGEIALYRLIEDIEQTELRHPSDLARSSYDHVFNRQVICLNGHVCCSEHRQRGIQRRSEPCSVIMASALALTSIGTSRTSA